MDEKLKKEAKKPPQKQFYTVKLEVMAPVELTLRVYAETPQEAIDMVSRNPLPPLSGPPRPNIARMKRIKATVYKAGTTIYYLIKNYTR
ncbi:hypothetical protein LCGC14_0469730 [marine sediment metagenome]|uniref:Uncharacterized protein n=1 Tax=marine sediment metagenome TaxID=412755 RepID=A0A0F9VLG2_9ZZZZ